jgi:hypothetical protein
MIFSTMNAKIFFLFFLLFSFLLSCDHNKMKVTPKRSIETVLNENAAKWMALEGVVGVCQGEQDGQDCIKILVIQKTKQLQSVLPKQADGYPVVIEETGVIRPMKSN